MTPRKSSLLGLLAALLLAACAPAQSAAPAAAPTAATSPSVDIVPLIRGARTAGYKVAFNLRIQNAGERDPRLVKATQYVKVPKTRYDVEVQTGGQNGTASVYALEDGRYSCPNMSGAEKVCIKLPQGQGQPQSIFDPQRTVQEAPGNFDVAPRAGRQIAGVTASCFTFTPKANTPGPSAAEACFSAEGIPLSYHAKDAGNETTMEATSLTRQVSENDFKLPAPVMEMPGGLPQPPGGPNGAPRGAGRPPQG